MCYRRCVIGDVLCDNPGKSRANCASLIQWGIREGCIGWIPSSGEPAPLKRGAWGGYWLNNYQFTIIKWHKAQYVRSTNAKRLILNPEPLTFTYLLPRIHTAFIYHLYRIHTAFTYPLSSFPQGGKVLLLNLLYQALKFIFLPNISRIFLLLQQGRPSVPYQ